MADGKVVGLDIGTSMIRVAIGEIDPDTGNIRIAGTASRKSAGLRNGVRVNIEDAQLAEKRVSILMGDDVPPRKEWIEENVEFSLEDEYKIEA